MASATKLSVDDLLEQIGSLTLLEAADLNSKMEEKFGVTAAAPMAMMAAPGAGGGAAAAGFGDQTGRAWRESFYRRLE